MKIELAIFRLLGELFDNLLPGNSVRGLYLKRLPGFQTNQKTCSMQTKAIERLITEFINFDTRIRNSMRNYTCLAHCRHVLSPRQQFNASQNQPERKAQASEQTTQRARTIQASNLNDQPGYPKNPPPKLEQPSRGN